MNKVEKFRSFINNPLLVLVFLNNKKVLKLSDEKYLKIRYYATFHKKLNLKNPQTFNEKMQWLKLYDRKEIYSTMVDKYEAKKYVAKIIGEKHIIPTLGIYDNFDDINFDELPNKFVIKCTHDSGGLIIVRDKAKLDKKAAKKKINKSLKRNYYWNGREWPYKNVKPRIIIEKFMQFDNGRGVIDYKFQTMNGKVKYCYICTDRETGNVKFTQFDENKKLMKINQKGYPIDPNIKLPKNYDEMFKYAEILAKDIPELRVDFYSINDKIYFGELTFFDSSGFLRFEPEDWDYKFGQMLDLSKLREEKNEK